MDAELKERAEKIIALTNSSTPFTSDLFAEIGAVHFLLTGNKVDCTECQVFTLISRINKFLLPNHLKTEFMAHKGQFKPKAPSQQIIRHTKTGTILITPDNLHEKDNFEFALKNFPHLVEEAPKKKEAEESESESEEGEVKSRSKK